MDVVNCVQRLIPTVREHNQLLESLQPPEDGAMDSVQALSGLGEDIDIPDPSEPGGDGNIVINDFTTASSARSRSVCPSTRNTDLFATTLLFK